MGNGCSSIIISEADWILLMPILYNLRSLELYKACLKIKFGGTGFLSDIQKEYEI